MLMCNIYICSLRGLFVAAVFQTADTNDAGLLDGEALYNALRALGLEVPVTETGIRDLLIRVGRQDEGYVDFDDFKKMVAELMVRESEYQ